MDATQKPERREVRLDDKLQARLREQALAERQAAERSLLVRRFVVLPVVLLVTVGSSYLALYGDSSEAMMGNLIASSMLWLGYKVRKRLPAVFGFG